MDTSAGKLPRLDQGRSLLDLSTRRPFIQIIGGGAWHKSGQRDTGRCSPRRVPKMPRDRRPEFKSQVRIKGRVVGIPKGKSKESFMRFHDFQRRAVKEGRLVSFISKPSLAASKAAARADGLIYKTDSDYLNAIIQQRRKNQVGDHSGRL